MRVLLFLLGVVLLIVPEFLRVYYIMPFPGSQEDVATDLRQVHIAYWLHTNIWWVRLIGLALLIGPFIHYMKHGNLWKRIGILLPTAFAVLVFYMFNFKFMADKMFYPPKEKTLTPVPSPGERGAMPDSVANHLAIVVERYGDARAYPIELIGYHHQVLDTIGGEPVMVTYCTVCRTGRAWKPEVNGQPETFRLVGMDHFNAMFEDSRTGSWWRQVTGECIEGPLKGQRLEEVPSEQLTLGEFSALHPAGLVFQPDPNFSEQYAGLKGFDDGTIESGLEYRDPESWQPKSWVLGVVHNGQARAYDWNDLQSDWLVFDTLGGDWIEIVSYERAARAEDIEKLDSLWARQARGERVDSLQARFYVHEPRSFHVRLAAGNERFSCHGSGVDPLSPQTQEEARVLDSLRIPSYQEFWHSWRTFHPNTTRYEPKK